MINSPGIEFIRNEMDWDTYDAWGCVQSARFDLCEAWWAATGEQINEYHPSVFLVSAAKDGTLGSEMTERAGRIGAAVWASIVTKDDVLYWMGVLNKMYNLVQAAGRDY